MQLIRKTWLQHLRVPVLRRKTQQPEAASDIGRESTGNSEKSAPESFEARSS